MASFAAGVGVRSAPDVALIELATRVGLNLQAGPTSEILTNVLHMDAESARKPQICRHKGNDRFQSELLGGDVRRGNRDRAAVKVAKRSGDLQGRHAATFSLSAPHVAVCLSFVRAKV